MEESKLKPSFVIVQDVSVLIVKVDPSAFESCDWWAAR